MGIIVFIVFFIWLLVTVGFWAVLFAILKLVALAFVIAIFVVLFLMLLVVMAGANEGDL